MQYPCDKITINRGGSHIDCPKWQKVSAKVKKKQVNKEKEKRKKIKQSTINPKNDGANYFRYAMTIALNNEQVGRNPKGLKKSYHFITVRPLSI